MKLISSILIPLFLISILSCNKREIKYDESGFDVDILYLINEHRLSIDLNILTFNETIWKEAQIHSENMAEGSVDFGHDDFTERIDRIYETLPGNASAENVAMGYETAEDVVTGWLNSSGHKDNIEGNYSHTGLSAIKNSEGVYYYTQIFIKAN